METSPLDRAAYRAAVSTIAEKARTTLPLCNGRVDKAVKLVLGGDVALHADGTATVGSMSDARKSYAVAHSACDCQDFSRAPDGFCAHRLAVGIARRAQELTAAAPIDVTPTALPPGPVPALPEAPASVNVRLCISGRDVQWTLRDTDEGRLAVRLEALLARYPVETASTLVAAPTQPPVCNYHGAMKPSSKAPGSFYCTKKLHDGSYCGERFPEKGGSHA
jgi:hypothetical protein